MLQIVPSKQTHKITLDSLYHQAKDKGMFIKIEENRWNKVIEVSLNYRNEKGSSFTFEGKSIDSVIDAFLNAFKEAEIVGLGYE